MTANETAFKQHYLLSLNELADLLNENRDDLKKQLNSEGIQSESGGRTFVSGEQVRECLQIKGHSFAPTVISHLNLKGGIGKTTASISLASRAKSYGYKTCILDLDPQGSATLAFDQIPDGDEPIFSDLWQEADSVDEADLKEIENGLFILPSSLDNSLLDSSLQNPLSQRTAVSNVCDALKKCGFDLIVIDTPPSLGAAVISSICASDTVVIPIYSDAFSFKGLEITMKEIGSICQAFNISMPRVKSLFTRYDKREKATELALAKLKEEYSDIFIGQVIRTSTLFSKALEQNTSVFAFTQKNAAKDDYDAYTRYILNLNF